MQRHEQKWNWSATVVSGKCVGGRVKEMQMTNFVVVDYILIVISANVKQMQMSRFQWCNDKEREVGISSGNWCVDSLR